jgi:hypothetical protein
LPGAVLSLGSFTLDIQRFVDKAKGNIDIVIRKIALDIFKRVILKSPVDTGRFKGNWQVAIGEMPVGTLELDDKSGTATISKMQAVALGLEAGQIIYLVNNLVYGPRLEYGYSKQAPNGMVRLTLQEFPGIVVAAASEVAK